VVAPSREDYVAAVRSAGAVDPWSAFWDDYYGYEVVETPDGWTPSTDRAACAEDLDALLDVPPAELWARLPDPSVLIRAKKRIGGGLIVPPEERDRLLEAAPHVRLVETQTDHFTVMTDPLALDAIRGVL